MCGQKNKKSAYQANKEKNIFKEIDLQIMLINEKIKNHKKSMEKAKQMMDLCGPAGVSGMDYAREPGNRVHISFAEGIQFIAQDAEHIRRLKEERAELRRRIKRIKDIYANLDGNEGRIYYLRVICGMTQEEAAEKMGFSKRHFQRMEAGMRERGLM